MTKFLKRIGILFLVLSVLLVTVAVPKETYASTSAWGTQLPEPEDGWKRFNDRDTNISYSSEFNICEGDTYSEGEVSYLHCWEMKETQYVKFSFYGTEIRLLNYIANWIAPNSTISIDGGQQEPCTGYSEKYLHDHVVFYEKIGLNEGMHSVVITIPVDKSTPNKYWGLDSIDIDSNGYLSPYEEASKVTNVSSLVLDKEKDTLTVGQTDILSPKILPDNASNKKLVWSSSNTDVVTVDDSGKVTALKEGSATVTAKTTDGSNLSASCEITVVKQNEGRAILTITMSNNTIKTYDISKDELDKFINWYDSRSKGIGLAYYVMENEPVGSNKTNKDYIPYDKIEYFNVQEY